MATPYSDPNLYFRLAPVQTVNWDLAFKALEYKQGQYDTNKLRVDTMLQNYLSTDIIKPEAKQRFVNNIQNLVNEINATGRTDFSDSNISNRVMAHIGQALDAPTVSAIAASKQYRQQEAFLQELQTKKHDLYSSINHRDMYERKGPDGRSFNDWLYDGDATSTYSGTLQYTPYVNVDKKIDDAVMKLMKMNGDEEIEIPDPTDPTGVRTLKYKINGLSENQLRQIVEYSLTSPEDQAQLEINARASYNWFKNPEDRIRVQEDLTNFITPKLTNINASLKETELKLSTVQEGSELHKKLNDDITILKNNRDYYSKLQTELTASASEGQFDRAASQIFKARYSDAMVNKYAPIYKEQFVGYGVDEYGKWKTEFDFEVQKENARRAEALEKAERERAEKEAASQSQIVAVGNPLVPEEIDSLDSEIRDEQAKLAETVIQTSKKYFKELEYIVNSGTDVEKVKEASDLMQAYRDRLQTDLQNKHGLNESIELMSDKSLEELMTLYDENGSLFAQVVKDSGGIALKTAVGRDGTNYVETINTASSEFMYRSRELTRIENEARESLYNEDQTPLLQEISSGQYQFFTEDGRVLDLKQELIKEEILDANGNPVAGAKLSDSKWAKDIERSFVSGELLRSNPSVVGINATFARTDKNLENIEALANSFQEKAEDIITHNSLVSRLAGSTDNPLLIGATIALTDRLNLAGTARTFKVDPNSKTGQYLLNANNNYQDRTWAGALFGSPKTSLAGDGRFSSLFYGNKDYRKTQKYRDDIKKLYGNLETSKSISVSSQSPEGKFLIQLANSNTREGIGAGTINESLPVILNKNSDGTIVLTQKQVITKDKEQVVEVKNLGTYTQAEISQFPSLINRINWEQQKVIYTREAVQDAPITTDNISYWSDSTPIYNANSVLGNDPVAKRTLKSDDAVLFIYENSPAEIQQMIQSVDPDLPQGVRKAIDKSSNYKIKATIKNEGLGDFVYLELIDTKNKNQVIYSTREENMSNLDGIMKILQNTPQVLYTTMLSDIIKENYNRNLQLTSYGAPAEFTTAYKKLFETQQ